MAYEHYLKWKEEIKDSNVESSISQDYRTFEGGHYTGFGRGLKYGLIAGIALSGLGAIVISLSYVLLNPPDFSKGLEKQAQTPVANVEKSR